MSVDSSSNTCIWLHTINWPVLHCPLQSNIERRYFKSRRENACTHRPSQVDMARIAYVEAYSMRARPASVVMRPASTVNKMLHEDASDLKS